MCNVQICNIMFFEVLLVQWLEAAVKISGARLKKWAQANCQNLHTDCDQHMH